MYLGLTKAPIYYMDLMKKDFMEYPNKIVVVFINDVLVYSMDEEEHKEHLRLVLSKLQDPRLYAKLSKRNIWIKQVSFLSHVISGEGISIDSSEIQDTLS
jgi:Zn-dependent M16 (insulinase) family peptidase